jgi:hypothetical protein
MGNPHVDSARLSKWRELRMDIWRAVLSPQLLCSPIKVEMWGPRWDETSWPKEYPYVFRQAVRRREDLYRELERGRFGVCVPQVPGWNSTKPLEHVKSGSLPLLWGTGQSELTFDKDERHSPMDAPWRLREDDGPLCVERAIQRCWGRHEDFIEYLESRMVPSVDMLVECVDRIAERGTPAFRERFGGYYPAS